MICYVCIHSSTISSLSIDSYFEVSNMRMDLTSWRKGTELRRSLNQLDPCTMLLNASAMLGLARLAHLLGFGFVLVAGMRW